MLKNLIKVANRLDNLGLSKEADLLDSIIKKIAGMGEGPPAYMSAGPGDWDLQLSEKGEWEYPEESVIHPGEISSSYEPKMPAIEKACRNLHEAIDKYYVKLYNFTPAIGTPNLVSKLNEFKNSLTEEDIEDLGLGGLDSLDDVKDSIEELISMISDNDFLSHIHRLDVWSIAPEEVYYISSIGTDGPNLEDTTFTYSYLYKVYDHVKEGLLSAVRQMEMRFDTLENAADYLEEIAKTEVYQKIQEIQEIIDPAMMMVRELTEIAKEGRAEIEAAKDKLSTMKMPKAPPYYHPSQGWSEKVKYIEETSPEQAEFEESQVPFGKKDIAEPWEEDEPEEPEDLDEDEDEYEEPAGPDSSAVVYNYKQ